MARKGENIYKRKDGRWEGRYVKDYSPQGKAKFGYVYGKTYADVKKTLTDRKAGINESIHQKNKKSISIKEAALEWLQIEKIRTKESTYSRYITLVENHIIPRLGDILVSNITTNCVEWFISDLLLCGRLDGKGGLSPKTVSDILVVFKSVLSCAANEGFQSCCNTNGIIVKQTEKITRVLSCDEQNRLITTLLMNTDRYKLAILLSLFTGMRIGEICALKWEDIDLQNKLICVSKTMQRIQDVESKKNTLTKVIITSPKSKHSIRDIPIPDCICGVVSTFRSCSNCFVLTGDAFKYVEPRKLQYHYSKIIKTCHIQNANFHVLRHTFATRCVELGFETKSLSEILGHANVNITLNRYVHSSLELKRTNMNRLYINYEPSK